MPKPAFSIYILSSKIDGAQESEKIWSSGEDVISNTQQML